MFGESRQFLGVGLSLRSGAGFEDVLDESCGGDAEDELVPELDDNPGTPRGTTFSVLQRIVSPWSSAAFDRWPTHRFRLLRRAFQVIELQACPRVVAITNRLAVATVVVFLDLRRVSILSELKTFLLSMCIDAQRCPGFNSE